MSHENEELLANLARVIVRFGERVNLALQKWTEEAEADSNDERVKGRIEAGTVFAHHLRDDTEASLPVDEVYKLANQDAALPESEEDAEAKVRRRLRVAISEKEYWRTKAESLQELINRAGQETNDQQLD